MKKIVVLFLFFTISIKIKSQILDTIHCNNINSTYIILPAAVDLVDIGAKESYVSKIEDNSVFIKAKTANGPISTLLIKVGQDFYYTTIKFDANNKQYFYDYKTNKPGIVYGNKDSYSQIFKTVSVDKPKVETKSQGQELYNEDGTKKQVSEKVVANTDEITKVKNELSTYGFKSDFIDAAVTVIRNDNENTYLKIIIKNNSSIPYKLDFISFQYFQDMNKGILKKSKKAPTDVFPSCRPKQLEVKPVTTNALGYAIPTFALAHDGYLMVLFRETNGDRVLKIEIPGTVVQRSQNLFKQ